MDTTGAQQVPSDHQEALCYCTGDGALAQVAQRGYEVSSLEISKSYLDMVLDTLLWISLLEQ